MGKSSRTSEKKKLGTFFCKNQEGSRIDSRVEFFHFNLNISTYFTMAIVAKLRFYSQNCMCFTTTLFLKILLSSQNSNFTLKLKRLEKKKLSSCGPNALLYARAANYLQLFLQLDGSITPSVHYRCPSSPTAELDHLLSRQI